MKSVLSEKEAKIFAELLDKVESEGWNEEWGTVYIDNCTSAGDKSFSGILASLTKKGLYKHTSYCFGEVKLNGEGTKMNTATETKKVDRVEFEATWQSHVNELGRLYWNTTEEDKEKLTRIMKSLTSLVSRTAHNYALRNEEVKKCI